MLTALLISFVTTSAFADSKNFDVDAKVYQRLESVELYQHRVEDIHRFALADGGMASAKQKEVEQIAQSALSH